MRSARTRWPRVLLTGAMALVAGAAGTPDQVAAAAPSATANVARAATSQADELEKREKAARSPDDLFQVGQWADKKGLKPQAKRLMQRVLVLDPKHVGANEYFGRVLHKGEWISPEEREKRIVESEGPAMRAKGLVRWQGQWVTPEDQAHLEKGEVLFEGKWLPFPDAQRARGLEEFEGQWLPRAEAIARGDVAASVQVSGTPVNVVVGPDAIVCGVQDEAMLEEILAGLAKGRTWFDSRFQSKPGLELFGGRLAEFYLYDSNDAFALTVPHFGSLTRTVTDGWVEAAQKTHGFLWWDPYPLSSARRWHRNESDLVGHCYHHWGHLLANRLEYDGRLLPPWFDEGVAALMEFRVHGRNDVFCRGSRKDPRPAGPSTGGGKGLPKPRTKVGGASVRTIAPFDPKAMQDGAWLEALKAGLIQVPPFDDLASLQFDELESADIAASMAIVDWIESRGPGALRRFHAELRQRAPPQPQRVLESSAQRMVCYEAAFKAAANMGLAEADKAWEGMDSEPLNPRDLPRIPGYRVEGVLGRGATGTVYRARQISVDRLVALKVLHPDLVGAKGAEHRLQREARATARLAHPHIISAIDMGEQDGLWWYAMELVDGVSLQERIQAGVLSEREALRTFIPIAEALQHAFERGVVHRDVKPANILLERGGRALLVDLGLAFADDDPLVTKSGSTLGTPHYISPEQARDPSTADAQSDLWSLGATMYHAVCGRPPFSGASVAEILSAVLYEPVPDPAALAPQISSGFALVLRKCLARDRSKRYETPAELLADLERVRERRAPNVRRSALEPVAPGRMQRVRRLALTGTAVVAGVVVLWYAVGGRGDVTPHDTQSAGNSAAQDPVDSLLAAAEGPAAELGPALANAVQLVRSLRPDSAAAQRAATARAHLEARLAAEIRRFQIASEPRFEQAVREHRYDEAHALAADALRREFAASTGGAALPPDLEETLGAWLAALDATVAKERGAAETKYRAALLDVWRKSVQPEVRSLVESGRWRRARDLLTTEVRSWAEEPAIPRNGVPSSVVEQSLARLREEHLGPALAQLDARWIEIDGELRDWARKRATELRGALEGRTLSDGAAVLRAEWELELERRTLKVAEMPSGLLHEGHEELAKGERDLGALARSLAVDDARRGLAEFEEETHGLWRARKYDEVAELHERALSEAWRQPVRAEHELRAREARLLSALLGRAAAALMARDGERMEVRLGTITLTGKLAAGPDPLNRGFSLALDGGRNPPLALRSGIPVEGVTVVGADMIEALAGFAATPDDRLLRVLFRLREGDPIGARDALDAGALPRDEPLVTDAERRVQQALDVRRDAVEEQQNAARDRYHLALREGREGLDPERLAKRIERLLREDASFLTQEEVQELRRLRDERLAELQPPTPSLEDLMRPNSLEKLPGGRVRLRYDFSSLRLGGFDTGTWIQEGKGVVSTRPALSDEDFLSRAAPNLVLREPIQVQNDAIDVRLRFQPKPDARPDLLLVTVCGLHVVTVPGRDGRPARVLVDSGDPAQLVKKARVGEEKQLPPRGGQEFELRIVVRRSKGTAAVELDGQRLGMERAVTVPNEFGNRLISIKSFEPVRLVSATIEATVR